MTAPGHISVQTPIAGLVELALTAPTFTDLIDRAERSDPTNWRWSDRPARGCSSPPRSPSPRPLLVVTATGREADDLTAELRGVFGDGGGDVPVLGDAAARAALARRRHRRGAADAAAPADASRRRQARPAAAGRGDHGAFAASADDARRGQGRAGGRCGSDRGGAEIAIRGAHRRDWSSWPTPGSTWSASAASSRSAAAFSTSSRPTAEHPVRVEFWGDEVTEMRMFSVADQRSIPEIPVDSADRGGLPGAAAHRRGAGAGRGAGRRDPRRPRATSPAPSATCWPSSPRASRSTGWRRCCRCCAPTTSRC